MDTFTLDLHRLSKDEVKDLSHVVENSWESKEVTCFDVSFLTTVGFGRLLEILKGQVERRRVVSLRQVKSRITKPGSTQPVQIDYFFLIVVGTLSGVIGTTAI